MSNTVCIRSLLPKAHLPTTIAADTMSSTIRKRKIYLYVGKDVPTLSCAAWFPLGGLHVSVEKNALALTQSKPHQAPGMIIQSSSKKNLLSEPRGFTSRDDTWAINTSLFFLRLHYRNTVVN